MDFTTPVNTLLPTSLSIQLFLCNVRWGGSERILVSQNGLYILFEHENGDCFLGVTDQVFMKARKNTFTYMQICIYASAPVVNHRDTRNLCLPETANKESFTHTVCSCSKLLKCPRIYVLWKHAWIRQGYLKVIISFNYAITYICTHEHTQMTLQQ